MAHLIEDEDGAPYPEGVQAIARERGRQITELGYDEEHDRQHTPTQLAVAASNTLAFGKVGHAFTPGVYDQALFSDPDRRNLERAGALIAAAIDRLDSTTTPDQKD